MKSLNIHIYHLTYLLSDMSMTCYGIQWLIQDGLNTLASWKFPSISHYRLSRYNNLRKLNATDWVIQIQYQLAPLWSGEVLYQHFLLNLYISNIRSPYNWNKDSAQHAIQTTMQMAALPRVPWDNRSVLSRSYSTVLPLKAQGIWLRQEITVVRYSQNTTLTVLFIFILSLACYCLIFHWKQGCPRPISLIMRAIVVVPKGYRII